MNVGNDNDKKIYKKWSKYQFNKLKLVKFEN